MLYGYLNKLSFRPGDLVEVMADAQRDCAVEVALVALRREDGAVSETRIPWEAEGRREIEAQRHCVGSFVTVDGITAAVPPEFSVGAWIWPTDISRQREPQGIVGDIDRNGSGYLLAVDGTSVVLQSRSRGEVVTEVRAENALRERAWSFVVATVGRDADHVLVAGVTDPGTVVAHGDAAVPPSRGAFTIGAGGTERVERQANGARGIPILPFNGKIERPFIRSGGALPSDLDLTLVSDPALLIPDRSPLLLACWDFGRDIADAVTVHDVCGRHPGAQVNLPARGVTGVNWTGEAVDFTLRPREYAALHFHEDDLSDVGWKVAARGVLPADLLSGVYGISLRADDERDVVPLIVVPRSASARVAVVLPVFTYLAYANEHLFAAGDFDVQEVTGRSDLTPGQRDLDRLDAPQFGRALYDKHSDGSGVMFSSSARALLNQRADYKKEWLLGDGASDLGQDMYLLQWLRSKEIDVDLLTDVDVHTDPEVLLPYSTVLTGAHPEYASGRLLDAYESYLNRGGHVMYLGGNGFVWVTAVHTENPVVIELRRGHAGIRNWFSEPGEVTLASTGEPGGLWRFRGRAPQRVFGVGSTSEGQSTGRPFIRTAASFAPAHAWMFEGVETEEIGTAGLICGAAAGHETDRADVAVGTPPAAVVVATATGFDDFYQRAIEELGQTSPRGHGGTVDDKVRADMVHLRLAGGGEVFSTSSIAWSGSLVTAEADPAPSRITENVLRRFSEQPSPLLREPERVRDRGRQLVESESPGPRR